MISCIEFVTNRKVSEQETKKGNNNPLHEQLVDLLTLAVVLKDDGVTGLGSFPQLYVCTHSCVRSSRNLCGRTVSFEHAVGLGSWNVTTSPPRKVALLPHKEPPKGCTQMSGKEGKTGGVGKYLSLAQEGVGNIYAGQGK